MPQSEGQHDVSWPSKTFINKYCYYQLIKCHCRSQEDSLWDRVGPRKALDSDVTAGKLSTSEKEISLLLLYFTAV